VPSSKIHPSQERWCLGGRRGGSSGGKGKDPGKEKGGEKVQSGGEPAAAYILEGKVARIV